MQGQRERLVSAAGRLARWILPVLLLAVGIIGAVVLVRLRPEVQAAPPAERVWTVRAVEVHPGPLRPMIRHFGRIHAARTVSIAPAVGGRVVEVAPELAEGAVVEAGTVLLRIDPFPYEQSLAELEARRREQQATLARLEAERRATAQRIEIARRQLDLAERELARQQRLVAGKVASPRVAEEAERQVLVQREGLVQLERQLAVLEAERSAAEASLAALDATIARARRDLADTVLRAPERGIVTQVRVATGDELAPRQVVARLYPLAALELVFSVTEAEYGRLLADGLAGREVRARWLLGEREVEVRGNIARVVGEVDPKTGGIGLHAPIEELPDPRLVRPGAFVTVEIPDRVQEKAVRLPRGAVYGGDTVYAIEEGRLVPRRVRIVAREGATVVVTGAIRDGDRILTTRLPEAGPGVRVAIAETAS